jgi:hypothetical protein
MRIETRYSQPPPAQLIFCQNQTLQTPRKQLAKLGWPEFNAWNETL